ncbi:uncharacterized protein N7482_005489 [Penicillium canariense]|uniref:DNA mismatch repair protein MutS-like N-terminal domain-containing protein n=1 Tax=Penicillium canariense TaxID=189055 RepID=A0A9W9I4R7_9EURO|nr:uncharacterized protein N7482_005489 [Penicillium canariense]KAJ5166708.1 hypothetical protein N7482_005489 [Penicillium canariense]
MAPHSSPSSSAASPPLKRKQATISSFFTQKPSSTPKPALNGTETATDKLSKKRPASPREPSQERKRADPILEDEEDDDDEIVVPPPKRARTNGSATEEARSVPTEIPLNSPSQLSNSQRTGIFKFQSSPAVAPPSKEPEDTEDAERRKEKEKLHQKFVRKLGGPDCLIGIGRNVASDLAGAAAEAEEGEEDDEPAPPPPTKGKGAAKKGGSKLTPMEKQVIEIKRKHMDTVLVIEVGYKFRFFGEDARVAAKELGIVCIPGKFRFDEHPSEAHIDRFASASIPVHRLHVHVKRLITAGHKVGVVRQIETAALKAAGDNRNAPFVRKLTNLYTKGTYIDDVEGLEGPAPAAGGASPATGYMLCIMETNAKGWGNDERVHVGIVAVQPTTGDVIYDDFEDGFMRSEIETRLLHIAPCEILIVGGDVQGE